MHMYSRLPHTKRPEQQQECFLTISSSTTASRRPFTVTEVKTLNRSSSGDCARSPARGSLEPLRTIPWVERFNQTLLKMLGTLENSQKSDWKSHVPTLVHAYNCTVHDSTGYSPYFLMFGHHPRLAIDAFLGLNPAIDETTTGHEAEYVRKLRSRLDQAYDKARHAAKRSSMKQKTCYDRTVRSSVLKPGDIVLVRNVGLQGKNKLADRWEQQPHVVKRQPISGIPVYEVVPEHGRGRKVRTLHRNLLLPFMSVAAQPDEDKSGSDGSDDQDSSSDEDAAESPGPTDVDVTQRPADETIDRQPYIIPMRRRRGQPGVLPRSRPGTGATEVTRKDAPPQNRPRRQKRKPAWMTAEDWVLPHTKQHVFTVSADQVIYC